MSELIYQAGNRYRNYSFQKWIADTPRKKVVKEAVMNWALTYPEAKAAGEGILMYGSVGTGKDHLAFAACAMAVVRHGATVGWVNGRDLFGEVRDRIGEDKSEESFLSKIRSKDIFVICDPLPAIGELTQAQADMLYRIIENRYAEGKITIVTLNVPDDATGKKLIGVNTWDRICDGAMVVKFDWPTFRKPARII